MTRQEAHWQHELSQEIADAVTRYLAEEGARVPARVIIGAMEDAKADLRITQKEDAA